MAGYIDTPRTQAGNATYMGNIDDLSLMESVHSPSKDDDLLRNINKRKDLNLRTPRVRAPFGDRRNQPTPGAEFTPLLKSVTKNNHRKSSGGLPPTTPGLSKSRYGHAATPLLPVMETSPALPDYSRTSSVNGDGEGTPMPPQVFSSSLQSTPLAALPEKDGNGAILNGQGVMGLKEQQKVRRRSCKGRISVRAGKLTCRFGS